MEISIGECFVSPYLLACPEAIKPLLELTDFQIRVLEATPDGTRDLELGGLYGGQGGSLVAPQICQTFSDSLLSKAQFNASIFDSGTRSSV